MDLKRPEPVQVEGTPVQHTFTIFLPYWQEGWGQHTIWSVENPAASESTVWVTVSLYDATSYSTGFLVDSGTPLPLTPGASTIFDTHDSWYTLQSDSLGVATLTLEYDNTATSQVTERPTSNDTVAVWSAVYSMAPNNRKAGYQVTSPETPIRPVNLDATLTNHREQGHGPGTYLQPFWTRNSTTGEQMCWMLSNISAETATITVCIRTLDGQQAQETSPLTLEPGDAFFFDTEPGTGWYALDDGLSGVGEIEVTGDPEVRVQFWSSYYGFYQGLPIGFDVGIR
jgi:hypothetical protein